MPGRSGDPGDQIEKNLNTGDDCIPDKENKDFELTPLVNHQNDQCYIVYTNGATSWVYITLPNNRGRVKVTYFSSDLYTVTKIISLELVDENGNIITTPWDRLICEFISGISAGLHTLMNQALIFSVYDLVAVAANVSSMKDYFDEFCKITGKDPNIDYWGEASSAFTFMKHAIIGGYIASKMQNFGLEKEDQVNRIFGFWVSFWAERAQIWYGTSHKIPINSTPNELGLVDIANFCKVLAIAEHGGGEIIYDLFSSINSDYMNVKSGLEGYDADKDGELEGGILVGDPEWWLFNGGNGTNKMNYENITYKGNLFINISLGVGILFNKIRTATPSSVGFHTSLSLYDWLVAGRAYNGDTRGKGTETYNHSKKLVTLLRKLYGTSWNNQILNDFLKRLDKLAEENKKNGNILSKDIFYPYP